MQKRGLGRGLESLIPGFTQGAGAPLLLDDDQSIRLEIIPVTKVVPNPNQPRKHFDEESFAGLVSSVKEHGLVQPIIVRTVGSLYEIVAGERRWRAAKEADLKSVPAIVKDATDIEALEMAIIENVQRQDLNALEEAAAYYHLVEDFDFTQEQVAAKVGKNRSTVANTIRLLQLPDAVKELVFDGKLSAGHARALLSLPSEDLQVKLADRIIKDGITVRQTESMVRLWLNPATRRQAQRTPLPYKQAARTLSKRLSAKVRVKTQGEKGKVEIHFKSDDDLRRIFKELVGENEIDGLSF